MRNRVKKILLVFIISGCTVVSFAGNPAAYLNFASFATPHGNSYFETYISVIGRSLNFVKGGNNKFSAKAHITISFEWGDSIAASANFNVLSPEVDDTVNKPNFKDAHRFWLKKGNYTL
ncbi:MAG TPA: hypothetical protein VK808_00005, partial [Bacteroidia bacterium]|nr:hypothetical protein [Bacteroidia bacterium]